MFCQWTSRVGMSMSVLSVSTISVMYWSRVAPTIHPASYHSTDCIGAGFIA